MEAALHAADETIQLLLSRGANPDALDSKGFSALLAATISGCTSTVSLLAPVTIVEIEKTLRSLAEHHLELTPPIAGLVSRVAEKHNGGECDCGVFFSRNCAAIRGLDYATAHGHSQMVKLLTKGWSKTYLDSDIANLLLREAVMSDSGDTVSTILSLNSSVDEANMILAAARGWVEVQR